MDQNNPFDDEPGSGGEAASPAPAAGAPTAPIDNREITTVPSSVWTVAGYILLFALLGFTGFSLFKQKEITDAMRAELATRAAIIDGTENRVVVTESQIIALQSDLRSLNREKSELIQAQTEAANAQKSLKDEMIAALESRDVTISELQGELTLNIVDRILFDSGQAIIKPEGEHVLQQIGGVLNQVTNRQIHVLGHTDNVPIRTSNFPSNWELSAARALAAVRFLVDDGGVKPGRIAAVAHGQFQPIASNATPEGRARNRRITIVVLPEVFKTPEKTIEEEPPDAVPVDIEIESEETVQENGEPTSDATEIEPDSPRESSTVDSKETSAPD